MRRIAHIINPVIVPDTSDLKVAQPITFESMRVARQFAKGKVDVSLLTTQFPEDRSLVPTDFTITPDLERSVLDLDDFEKSRKLPLLRDILDRAYEYSDAEYLIYTNVDIALMPSFYLAVSQLIDEGYDAFSITRRVISDRYSKPEELPMMYAEHGESHPGHDCFVFKKEVYPEYVLSNTCIGAPSVGHVLLLNLSCQARRFRKFKDKHLTFHLGNDCIWKEERFDDYYLYNRKCALEAMHELQNKHGNLDQDVQIARIMKLLGMKLPPLLRLKSYFKRKLKNSR